MLKDMVGQITLGQTTWDCPAGTGAAVVLADHDLQGHLAPHSVASHRTVRAPFAHVAAVRPDCSPGVSGGPSAQKNGAMFKTLVLFAFVVASSAILDLGDAVARGRDYLKELLGDRGNAFMG